MIQPTGPQSSKLMVITDWPSKEDLPKGRIFSGKQGWLFEQMCDSAGTHAKSMYITPAVTQVIDLPPQKITKGRILKNVEPVAKRIYEIKGELDHINPNVILTVGEFPLQYLTGNQNVKKFQGSILSLLPAFGHPNIKVIPIVHPRDIWKVYQISYYTPIYIKRAVEQKDNPNKFKEPIHLEVVSSIQGLNNYIRENRNAPYVVPDIETYYNMISCIGISMAQDTAICIPFLEDTPSIPEMLEMFKRLQRLFNDYPVVNQNIMFDHVRVEKYGFRFPNVLGDTMLNAGILYPELRKDLGLLNSFYTNIPYFKDESAGTYRPSKKLYLYCAKDCVSTNKIYRAQMKEAEEHGVHVFIKNDMMKYYGVYKKINQRGFQIDTKLRDEKIRTYTDLQTAYSGFIEEQLQAKINPLSPKQCCQLLYDDLQLPEIKRRRANGSFSRTSDEDAIEYLILNNIKDSNVADILHKILYCRKIKKVLDYLNIKLHPGDIFRTNYNLAGTETGRTSTSKSGDRHYYLDGEELIKQDELGFALQTIPKHGFEISNGVRLGADIREIFVPRTGYIFCEADQSKAEAIYVTVLCEDWDLYEHFYDQNLHNVTAMAIFGIASERDITVDQYIKGKRVRHAGNYDAGAATLSKVVLVSKMEASKLLAAFHSKYWKVRGIFHAQISRFLRQNLWLNTPYGRRRDFFVNPKDQSYLREGYAYIPQSMISDKTKKGMVKTEEELNGKLDFHFLGESHDSAIAEVRIGQEHEFLHTFKKHMEEPIDMRNCCLPRDVDLVIRLDSSIGENWKDMKEVKIT